MLTNFTDITSSYDSKLDDYIDYVKSTIKTQLDDFISPNKPLEPENQLLECTYSRLRVNNTPNSCLADIGIDAGTYSVFYMLLDADGFYSNLTKIYGIVKAWVQFGEDPFNITCTGQSSRNPCEPLHLTDKGFPVKAPDSDITVTNLRDIMTTVMPNIQNLTQTMSVAKMELALGSWMGATDDMVQSISMAIFLLSQPVTNIQNVVITADAYDVEKKKELINDILMEMLLMIPFLGELDLVVDDAFAGMSRIIMMIGDAGVGVTNIYSIAEDPKMAPIIILEALLLTGTRDPGDFSTMATARRDMTKDDLASLGTELETLDGQFRKIVVKCLV